MHLEYILQSFLYETKVSKLYFTYSPVLYLYDNIFQGIFYVKKFTVNFFVGLSCCIKCFLATNEKTAVLRIRILMDPHLKIPSGSGSGSAWTDADPDPGGEKA